MKTHTSYVLASLLGAFLLIFFAASFGQSQKFSDLSSNAISLVLYGTIETPITNTTNISRSTPTTILPTKLVGLTPIPTANNCRDRIDNDRNGYTDQKDPSCAYGLSEGKIEADLNSNPELASMLWPLVPRFVDKAQCVAFCKVIFNSCAKTAGDTYKTTASSCKESNGCDVTANQCRNTDLSSNGSCNFMGCFKCVTTAQEERDRQIEQCRTNQGTCNSSCNALFPDTTSAGGITTN